MINEESQQNAEACTSTLNQETPGATDTIKATVALICGAASLICALFVPLIGAPAGIIFGIMAIVTATSFLKARKSDARARLGRLLGIIGLIATLLVFTLALTGHTLAALIDLDSNDVEVSVEV